MCIYFVKHYKCGHYADAIGPTLLAHCRAFDTCLRYWHDQVYYQPLEAASAQYGTIAMPKPCRPIWPIPFPGSDYLPLPNITGHPRGLARPADVTVDISESESFERETNAERIGRENYLCGTIGTFEEVVAHQELQTKMSILDESAAYQAVYPNTRASSMRLHGAPALREPHYPLAFISTIIAFDHARRQPGQLSNVIVINEHNMGCMRTYQRACQYDPAKNRTVTNSPTAAAVGPATALTQAGTTTTGGSLCPWLLSIRIPWLYPRSITTGLPFPHREAAFLADFTNRGGARSKHMERDPIGSEIIRVVMDPEDGSAVRVGEEVYGKLHHTVPEGPFMQVVPVVEEEEEMIPSLAHFARVLLLREEDIAALAGVNIAAADGMAGTGGGGWVEEEEVDEDEGENLPVEAGVDQEVAEGQQRRLPGYRYPAGGPDVNWWSEDDMEEGRRGMGRRRRPRRWCRSVGGS